ncbi:MAG: Wzz/FepE/Etk N-terminal domain-containing protein [Steroidobacteraceae bacterium]
MDVAVRIWRRRGWVIAGTLLAIALAVAYLFLAPRLYRAEAIVLPRESNGGAAGLMAQVGQLGGLASTLGINLAQGSKEEPLAVLRSKGFSRRFLETRKLVQLVDESRWPRPFRSIDESAAAEIDFAVEHFMRNILSVSQDKKTGLVYVAVEWTDPDVAAEWANLIVLQLNEEMRHRSLEEADQNISYLRQQVEHTESVVLKQSAAKLLENELNKKMLAAGSVEFAFRVVDEARPPLRPNTPRPVRTMFWSLVFGGICSILAVLAFDFVARVRMNFARQAPTS